MINRLQSADLRDQPPGLLLTTVYPDADRSKLAECLVADQRAGAQLSAEILGREKAGPRFAAVVSKQFPFLAPGPVHLRQSYLGTHYASGKIDSSGARAFASQIGAGLKCDRGWIGSFVDAGQATDHLRNPHHPIFLSIDQNSLLVGSGNVAFVEQTQLHALKVRAVEREDDGLADLSQCASATASWSFVHFVKPDGSRKADRKQQSRLVALLASETAEILKTNAGCSPTPAPPGAKRFSPGPAAMSFLKAYGFAKNAALTKGRTLVADKRSDGGNIIRLTVDAGGFNATIPQLSAQFIASGCSFAIGDMVPLVPLADTVAFTQLLREAAANFDLLTKGIAPRLDAACTRLTNNEYSLLCDYPFRGIAYRTTSG